MAAVQTTIKRLPSIAKEDTHILKVRIQELEKEVANYKSRLEELRKAKNNLIIKKTTEYVKLGNNPASTQRDKETTDELPTRNSPDQNQGPTCQEHERTIDNLNRQLNENRNIVQSLTEELDECKNLIAALKIENEDVKGLIDKLKNDHQSELASAYAKNEETMKEIHKWEKMYKEWMSMMEDRVTNINRTHSVLRKCLDDSNPESDKSN